MIVRSVVVLPPSAGDDPGIAGAGAALVAALRAVGLQVSAPVVPPDDGEGAEDPRTARAHWIGHTAMGVAASGVTPPVLLVALGAAGATLPALALAQRAARRAVGGYLLLDAQLPPAGGTADWPDAPVIYVSTPDGGATALDAAMGARLRGWEVVRAESAAEARAVVVTTARGATG